MGKTHKKIPIQSNYTTYFFDEVDALAPYRSELWYRLNLILDKAYRKGNLFKSRATEEQLDRSDIYVYFNRSETRHLGGKDFKRPFQMLEDAGLLVRKDLRNFKNGNQQIRAYLPLTIKPIAGLPQRITHKRIQTSLDAYYTAKVRGYSMVVQNKVIPSLRNVKINITEARFWTAVADNYDGYCKSKLQSGRIPLPYDLYKENYSQLWAEIQSWNTAEGNEIFQHITEDNFSGRVHTTITTLPRFIRELGVIEYKGEPLAELDIKTFQPLLLALMLDGTDFSQWFFSVNDCYEELMKLYDLPSRDAAKRFMYKLMFGTPYGKHHSQFCDMFPEAGELLTIIKRQHNPNNPNSYRVNNAGRKVKNFHSNAAFLMQVKEVSVMRHIWASLYRKQIPFATIHDAVLVPESKLNAAYELMYTILISHLKPAAQKIKVNAKIYSQKSLAA